jgi:hypothetical protein
VKRVALIVVFALAMALVEAMVVVYLREILGLRFDRGPLDQRTLATVTARAPWLLPAERWREAATLVMLVCFALLAERPWHRRGGVFLLAFGLWDLGYYLWLRLLLGWPPSLLTRDVLFLIPVPWVAPVLLPVAVAAGMCLCGLLLLRRRCGRA